MKRKNDHLKLVKKQNNPSAAKKFVRFVFRLALVLGILFLLQQGETFFRVNEIRVEGAGEMQRGDILNAGEISEGMSIFLLREKSAAERMQEQLPWVKQVEISRNLPDTVVITIDERRPAGYVITADGYWLIDNHAVYLDYTEQPTEKYPLISGIDSGNVIAGAPLDSAERRKALQNLFSSLPGENNLEIEKINFEKSYNLIVHTVDGLEIWFGDGEDIDYKLRLIEESISHIDRTAEARLAVRCGNRLVVSGSAVIEDDEKGVVP